MWIFCNFALAAVVLSAVGLERINPDNTSGEQRSTIYMAVVLWSVAGLSLFRFVGAMWFLITRLVSFSLFFSFPTFPPLLSCCALFSYPLHFLTLGVHIC